VADTTHTAEYSTKSPAQSALRAEENVQSFSLPVQKLWLGGRDVRPYVVRYATATRCF